MVEKFIKEPPTFTVGKEKEANSYLIALRGHVEYLYKENNSRGTQITTLKSETEKTAAKLKKALEENVAKEVYLDTIHDYAIKGSNSTFPRAYMPEEVL